MEILGHTHRRLAKHKKERAARGLPGITQTHDITGTYARPPTHPELVKAEREQAPALEEGRLV